MGVSYPISICGPSNHLLMSTNPVELWTWRNCREAIVSLPSRLGFPMGDKVTFLGYEIDTRSGVIRDIFMDNLVDLGKRAGRRIANTIFYVLSAYSESEEKQPTGDLISSSQFRGTRFTKRDTMGENNRVTKAFKEPTGLIDVSKLLEGERLDFPVGDVAVRFNLLPYIPMTIVLTLEDEEFPADARFYYDETIENYLDSEQTYFLTHLTVSRLIQLHREH